MKADLHVHTYFSGYSKLPFLSGVVKESYNTPNQVYGIAKARGMDLIAITDHDSIDGALELSDHSDVLVGSEVTAEFPNDQTCVHLNVLDITAHQHREIQRLRVDIRQLMPYLQSQKIFTSLNHLASGITGPITGTHVAALLPWIDAVEIRNGSRLLEQNRTAVGVATGNNKTGIAGSDAHTPYGIGRTWTDARAASTKNEFLRELRNGRVTVHGKHGGYLRMSIDILQTSYSFYLDRLRRVVRKPLDWRRQAFWWCGLLGLPLITAPLVAMVGHFLLEERFNRELIFDLTANRVLSEQEIV